MARVNLLSQLKENPFVLAPMAGITDLAFRTLMRKLQSSVVVTELISANGIEYKNEKTLEMMAYEDCQRPVGIQLFGEDPLVLSKAAQIVEQRGADFVDLNFGCPVPKVTKKGGGSAVLKDLALLEKILSTVKKSISIPLTIKIRTGWDPSSRNAVDVCHIAYNEGVTWVAIHGRTRSQQYEGLADWDYITKVKNEVKIPIIGNGDILTAEMAVRRLSASHCDGIMIGRGVLKNPFLFIESLQLLKQIKFSSENIETENIETEIGKSLNSERNYPWVISEIYQLYSSRFGDQLVNIQLKKFAAWFSAGYPESAAFRKKIFLTKSTNEVLEQSLEYYNKIHAHTQEDTRSDRFLMGGHG